MPPFLRGHSSSWPDLLFIQETAVAEKPCLILTVRDCSILARMLWAESGQAGAERSEQGASWVGVLIAPSSCTKLLVLSRASPAPFLLCATLQLAQVPLSDVVYPLLKNMYGKDGGGTQRGWLLAPRAFKVSLFLWSCFLLVVTKC